MNVCHVYPYETADGPANMARDEALLEAAGTGESVRAFAYVWLVGADAQPGLLSAIGRGTSRFALSRRADRAAADGRGSDLAPSRIDVRARGAGKAPAGAAEHSALSSSAWSNIRWFGRLRCSIGSSRGSFFSR